MLDVNKRKIRTVLHTLYNLVSGFLVWTFKHSPDIFSPIEVESLGRPFQKKKKKKTSKSEILFHSCFK